MFYRATRRCALACGLLTLAACSGGGSVVIAGGDVGTGKISAGSTKWKAIGAGGVFEVEGFAIYYEPAVPVTCPVASVVMTVFKDRDRSNSYDAAKDGLIGSYSATAIPGSATGTMSAGIASFTYNPADDGPVMLNVKVCYGAPCETHCTETTTRVELKK